MDEFEYFEVSNHEIVGDHHDRSGNPGWSKAFCNAAGRGAYNFIFHSFHSAYNEIGLFRKVSKQENSENLFSGFLIG